MFFKNFAFVAFLFCLLVKCNANKSLAHKGVEEGEELMMNDGERLASAIARALDCVLLQNKGNSSALNDSTSTSSKISFSCYLQIKYALFIFAAALITASALVVILFLKIYSYARRFWNDRLRAD